MEDKFLREGNLLYSLTHHGWKSGVETFRNRIAVRFDFDKTVAETERESVMRVVMDALELHAPVKPESTAYSGPHSPQDPKLV